MHYTMYLCTPTIDFERELLLVNPYLPHPKGRVSGLGFEFGLGLKVTGILHSLDISCYDFLSETSLRR